jgi:D-arabinose 1-dehydrogenase-like Zn-dependent alcohol dehydrogenase
MRGAVITQFQQPLVVQVLPDPTPGPTDVIVQTEACGICRSDWHVWQHHLTWLGIEAALPRVPGHEFGGTVVEIGREVRGFRVGDRVTVPFHLGCGRCALCRAGRYNLCLAYGCIGVHHDGGYGNFVKVPSADTTLVHLPDSVDALTAAALGCRFMTSYHAVVEQGAVRPGEWVAVFGIGGVGLSAVQVAAAIGARVIAVGRSADKLAKARSEGAEITIQAGAKVAAEIIDVTHGGASVTIDALGSSETTLPALQALAKHGRHVQVGLTGPADAGVIAIPMDVVVFKELQLMGSFGCPISSYAGMLSMVAAGRLRPAQLVERVVSVDHAGDVLAEMGTYNSLGFSVINEWAPKPA